MRRRGFLGLGLGLAVAPALVRDAFGAGLALQPNDVARAWVEALDERKPLLVLVVPTGEGADTWRRGQTFGAWMNHGGVSALELMGLCVLACATPEALAELGVVASDEDLMVLVEGPELPARVTRIQVPLDPLVENYEILWEARVAEEERLVRANNELLTASLAAELAPDEAALRARLERSWPSLAGVRRSEIRTVLAGHAQATFVDAPVAGARWAHSGGCGMRFEDEDEDDNGWGVACGMGHVPALSGRLLYFWTQDE